MNKQLVGKCVGAVAGLAAIAVLPVGGASADPPRNPICEAHSTGFAGLYCLWGEPGDGRDGGDPYRPVDRSPARG